MLFCCNFEVYPKSNLGRVLERCSEESLCSAPTATSTRPDISFIPSPLTLPPRAGVVDEAVVVHPRHAVLAAAEEDDPAHVRGDGARTGQAHVPARAVRHHAHVGPVHKGVSISKGLSKLCSEQMVLSSEFPPHDEITVLLLGHEVVARMPSSQDESYLWSKTAVFNRSPEIPLVLMSNQPLVRSLEPRTVGRGSKTEGARCP